MQDIVISQEPIKGSKISDLPIEAKQRLVGAFVWLIKEDKIQNPARYHINKKQNDD